MHDRKVIKGLDGLVDLLKSLGMQVTRQTARGYIDDGLPHWKRKRIYHFYTESVILYFKEKCSDCTKQSNKDEQKSPGRI